MQGRGLPWCRQPEQILYFFLGLSVVQEETGTTARFALRLGPSTFGIFDAFPDESGRQAHLSGRVAAALMARAPELFSQPPLNEKVTAFFSSPDKEAEAKGFGADHFINSRDPEALTRAANSFDFILSTVNVPLDWPARNLCPPVRREVGRRLQPCWTLPPGTIFSPPLSRIDSVKLMRPWRNYGMANRDIELS